MLFFTDNSFPRLKRSMSLGARLIKPTPVIQKHFQQLYSHPVQIRRPAEIFLSCRWGYREILVFSDPGDNTRI